MKTTLMHSLMLFAAILTGITLHAETRFALGSGATNTITVGSFSSLSASFPVNVTYTPGTEGKSEITVVSTKPHEGDVVINKSDDELTITLDLPNMNNISSNDFDVQIRISGPMLKEITASMGAKVTVDSNMSVDSFYANTLTGGIIDVAGLTVKGKLEIDNSSGGSFHMSGKTTAQTLDLECAAGSVIRIDATVSAKETEIEASAASKIKINGVSSPNIDIDASAASKVELTSVKSAYVKIDASATSSVTLTGSAAKVSAEATSSARIDLKGFNCSNIRKSESTYGSVKTK